VGEMVEEGKFKVEKLKNLSNCAIQTLCCVDVKNTIMVGQCNPWHVSVKNTIVVSVS
jgi:hypothetical protein